MEDSIHPSEAQAKAVFAQFPEDFQQRVLREGDEIGEKVISHLVQVLIGVPGGLAPPDTANHASGVAVLIGHRRVFFTAQHVVAGFRSRKAVEPQVVFQVGNTSFDPEPRILFESAETDVVAIELNASDTGRFGATVWLPEMWPPTAPVAGEFVAFGGFAAEYRENGSDGVVDLAAIGGLLRVETASGSRFSCIMERDRLVRTRGPHVPPPGTRVGGMSGGPVFRIVNGKPVLSGIVTDFAESFEIFFMAPLSSISLSDLGAYP